MSSTQKGSVYLHVQFPCSPFPCGDCNETATRTTLPVQNNKCKEIEKETDTEHRVRDVTKIFI